MNIRFILLFIIMFVFIGCNTKKASTNFDYIDLSYESWEPYANYKLKIFNNGKINISRIPYLSKKINYSSILNKTQLDSVSQMINIIYNSSLDSIYIEDHDAIVLRFCLILKSKNKKNLIWYEGNMPLDQKKHIALNRLIEYLDNISKNINTKTDSILNFESYIRYPVVDTIDSQVEMVNEEQTFKK